MKEIIIKSAAEYAALPEKFETETLINIACDIYHLSKTPSNAYINVSGSAKINYVSGSAHINYVYDSAQINSVYGSAQINSVYDSAQINYVSGSASLHLHDTTCVPMLFAFAVAWIHGKAEAKKAEKTAVVIKVKYADGVKGWAQREGVGIEKGYVTIFKRVSSDYKTQEGTRNETLWRVGSTVEHTNWSPKQKECGEGKFHACSRTFYCDEFRNADAGDKYIALRVNTRDMYAWPNADYPHKIAFRKGKVLYECDRMGNKK